MDCDLVMQITFSTLYQKHTSGRKKNAFAAIGGIEDIENPELSRATPPGIEALRLNAGAPKTIKFYCANGTGKTIFCDGPNQAQIIFLSDAGNVRALEVHVSVGIDGRVIWHV